MIIEIGRFYKYKGLEDGFFSYNAVYKLVDILKEFPSGILWYKFENYKGKTNTVKFPIESCFTPSGVQEINWKHNEQKKMNRVDHPSHYTWLKELCGIEPIDICEHLNFNIGNAVKYLLREGKEDIISSDAKRVEDLQKAIWYINNEIKRLSKLPI